MSDTPVVDSTVAAPVAAPTNVSKIRELLSSGQAYTAPQLAVAAGLVTEGASKEDLAKAARKARALARKVIGHKADSKDGRNSVYKIA